MSRKAPKEPVTLVFDEFKGQVGDVTPRKLPESMFQTDLGGDRFKRGTWRRRRGMVRTDIAKQSNPVVSIIGFDLPGVDNYALMVAQGTDLEGFSNVTSQSLSTGGSGYGEGSYGDGAYGE